MNKVLNQEEINDLAQISKEPQERQLTEGKLYDLTSQDVNIYSRIQNIGLINERFSKNIKSALTALFKKNVEVNLEGIESYKFEDYIHSLSFPTSINQINVTPLNGILLLVADSPLIFCLVENYFGGEGKTANKIFDRNFTTSESRITKLVLEQMIKNLAQAWSHVMDVQFSYAKTESDPTRYSGMELSEMMVISKFKIEVNQIGGEFHVCYTAAMIDQVRDFMNDRPVNQKDKTNISYMKQLQEAVMEAKIDLHCILAHKSVSIGEVIKFKKGDLIPIEIPLEITLGANKAALFKSTFGTFEGKYAAKIIKKLKNNEDDNYGTK